MSKLELRCGCVVKFTDGMEAICPKHGEQRVSRTSGMRPPTFRGAVSGPHATAMDLGEFRGRIVGGEGENHGG